MADDKGAGGGSSWEWGVIEIIIGILLIIGVLDHVFGNGSLLSNKSTTTTDVAATQQVQDGDTCGLTVITPHANEKMLNTVLVSGTAGDCDWPTTPTVALYAQVVDSKGTPVSGYLSIPPARAYDTGAYFESTIALTKKPAIGTGYLILVPAVQPSNNPHSVSTRIPLRF